MSSSRSSYLYRITVIFEDESPLEAEKAFIAESQEEAERLCREDVRTVTTEVDKRMIRLHGKTKVMNFVMRLISVDGVPAANASSEPAMLLN